MQASSATSDPWVMAGAFRGELSLDAAELFGALAAESEPGEDMACPAEDLLKLTGMEGWPRLEAVLASLSDVSAILLAAPGGWVCGGGSLVDWSVSGELVTWRIPARVHSAFGTALSPSLSSLVPFTRLRGRAGARSLRLYCLLHRAASLGGELRLQAGDALALLGLQTASAADARRYGTDRSLRDVAELAPHLVDPKVRFERDWTAPGGQLARVVLAAAFSCKGGRARWGISCASSPAEASG